MEAKEREFSFIREKMILEVPFFQRGYVWNDENWEELLENLLDNYRSHFIGSIILKKQHQTSIGVVEKSMIIDGQQRLTTLSLLLRACFDSLPFDEKSEDWKHDQRTVMRQSLMYKENEGSEEWHTKIIHSRLDAADFNSVIQGDWSKNYQQIVQEDDKKYPGRILECYYYFRNALADKNVDEIISLWEILVGSQIKMIVKIDLGPKENEQAIFDTVNSAGVRLTSSDTIKNAIFQRAIENAGDDQPLRDKIIDFYSDTWERAFLADEECLGFWQKERSLGRFVRDNQEILLHAVALIKGFFSPVDHKLSDLPELYKTYIENFDIDEVLEFVGEICEYSNTYKEHFEGLDASTLYSFIDKKKQLLQVLDKCDISTFDPYILKLLNDNHIEKDSSIPDELATQFALLESYVMRHILCGVTTKSFNKECMSLVYGEKTIEDLLNEKHDDINDQVVRLKLLAIPGNKIAALILFWIELKRRGSSNLYDGDPELKYSYSLEHIMPQKWRQYWSQDSVQVIDVSTGEPICDAEEADSVRQAAIYELGNMTLLNSRLNTSLRNKAFINKVEGEGRKKGMKEYAHLSITKEVLDSESWDELKIRERTKKLTSEFLSIWKLPSSQKAES